MDSDTRRQLLADIASFYYIEKKTQVEIAQFSGYSRSAISRMLTEAEELGIIEINIRYPLLRDNNLERRLKEKYSLEMAFVMKSGLADYSYTLRQVGRLGSTYLQQILEDNMTIGIGWGSSLYELVNSLPAISLSNVRVVQVIGATGGKSDRRIDGPDLADLLASKLGADHQYLHSPAFLDDEFATQSLKEQRQIRETLDLGYQSDIVLLGIGIIEVDPLFCSILRTGYLNEEEIKYVKESGGMCNFCGVVMDSRGQVLDIEVNRRSVAVDVYRLRESGCKLIGIAAGSRKAKAIKAVLEGNWLDVLITDNVAAAQII
ncbi:MAG: hypothetical protein J7L66_03130 [Anaerolineaceae bacterium]|nr:hypothetical protein [Anaerolineaceae bacterium]